MKNVVLLGLALSVLAPVVAHADTPPSASPAVTDAARARLTEGLRLYKQKRYDKAQAAFLQAYALTKSPPVLLVLGLTTLKLGRPLEALHQLEQFQREAKDLTPEQKARAANAIAEAKAQLGAIEITAPEGTDVAIDGEKSGHAPFAAAIAVLPGKHTVSAGGESKTVDVKVQGVAKTTLGASSRAAPPPSAVVENSNETPPIDQPPPPPREAPGFFSPPDSMAPVYAAGAVGIASLTVAIVLGGIGANADRNVSNANDALTRNGKNPGACTVAGVGADPSVGQTCASLASAQKTQDDVKTPFVVALAAGAGSTAFALGWYLFAPKAGVDAKGPEVTPVVSPTGAGMRIRVVF